MYRVLGTPSLPRSQTDVSVTKHLLFHEEPTSRTSTSSKPLPSIPRKFSTFSGAVSPATGWRPFTLKPLFLLLFTAITIAIIVGLQVLLRKSQSQGALVFTASTTSGIGYVLNYGPVVVGVLYGLLWASVDHDVKRLEPYFQLSKPGGVSAEHSLLLEYPYEFAAFVPFLALRRKHWVVLMSATMLLLISYGVTPLSSTIISKESVNRNLTLTLEQADLLAADAQPNTLSTAFSYVAYSHQYLNGTLPPFTTEDFAVLPFRPRSVVSVARNETWVGNSTLYEARLECTSGKVEYREDKGRSRLSNADGDCAFFLPDYDRAQAYSPYVSGIFNKDVFKRESYMTLYGQVNCTGEADDVLVGFFGRTIAEFAEEMALTKFMNASLVFCTPVHEQQQIEVTVDAATSALKSWRRLGEKTPFTGLDMDYWGNLLVSLAASPSTEAFNITQHRTITVPWIKSDFQAWRLPDHGSQLKNMPQFQTLRDQYGSAPRAVTQVGWDFNGDRQQPTNVYFINPQSLTPFGLAKEEDLESLFDSTAPGEALADMYDGAYRYLFAMAIGSGLVTFDALGENTTLAARQASSVNPDTSGKRNFTQDGYAVDPTWVRVLQGVLGGVVLLSMILLGLTFNRSSELRGEPGSIASAMVHVDGSVLRDFQNGEFRTPSQLKASLEAKGHRYSMKAEKIMVMGDYGEELGPISAFTSVEDSGIDRSKVRLTKPWDLSVAVGILATLLLIGVMVALVVLFSKQKTQQGFRVPTDGFVYNLYANYLPTILATMFESFLVLLAIQVTLLFPFKKLTRGNSRPTSSLCANYDQTPPHLQVINAIRVRNGLLASLSICILAANVLAVAFGGLFHKNTVDFPQFGDVAIAGSESDMASFNSTSLVSGQFDTDLSAFYSSTGETLGFEPRSWTTGELFYVPFSIPDSSMRLSTNYTFNTLGFGVNFTCEQIPESEIIEWHSMVQVVNASSRGIRRTFSFLTFAAQNNTPVLWESLADTNLYRFAHVDDLENAALKFADDGYWNGSISNTYYEYAPVKYPAELQQDWDFFASWGAYRLDEDRKVNINRVFFPKMIYINETGGGSDNFYDPDFPYNGTTVEAPSMYIADRTIMRCKSRPRLVNSTIMADLDGNIYEHNDTEIALTGDLVKPANDTVFGLNGVLGKFQNMVLRVAGRSGGQQGVDSLLDSDPRPSNWLTFLANQHGRSVLPDFDLYSHPEQSVKSMEAVYKRTFAIYLQLYSEKIFPNISSTAAADSQGQTVRAMYTRPESRVLMQPVAFYVSLVLLIIFVPAVIWTFASLYHGFLTHQPTSLAGLYASLYASSALEDAKGTGHMDEKERARTMEAIGERYGYGWFVGRDGEIHVGIEREPLFRNKPQ